MENNKTVEINEKKRRALDRLYRLSFFFSNEMLKHEEEHKEFEKKCKEAKAESTYTQFGKRLKEDIKAVKKVRKVIGDDCITREGYTKYDALHMLACDLALCSNLDEFKKLVKEEGNDLPRDVYKQMQQYIERNVKEIEETEEPAKPWEEQERAVTLTNELCSTLQCYILMTTNHREGELKAWEELAQETDENGAPKFKNAAGNAQFWRDIEPQLQQILEALN